MERAMRALALVLAVAACTACSGEIGGDDGDDGGDPPDAAPPGSYSTDPLEGLPTGYDQWVALCSRGYNDTVTQAFCAGNQPPVLTSLADVRALLGLELVPGQTQSAAGGNPAFSVASHSTAVSMRHVNELNPRVLIYTPPLGPLNPQSPVPNPTYDFIAFARGEPFVELASKDTVTGEPRFFLIRFTHPCEQKPGGCTNGDRFTKTIEESWTGYSIYDDATIANTTVDCLQCHQPGGPGSPKMLRLQELTIYWNHWFFNESPPQDKVRADFGLAHAGEPDYGGLPIAAFTGIRQATPAHLQAFLQHNGFGNQPNAFHSIMIDQQMAANGSSAMWNALYAESVAGREIAAPHWSVSPSAQPLLTQMIDAYQDVLNGTLPPDSLPDISQTIPETEWADMSIRPKAGLDGRAIMVHICRHCHNSTLDQSLSRASFDVDALDTLSRTIKDRAIDRLNRPMDDRKKMPPPRFHDLTDAERAAVIQVLSQ
jgi:hypothetical protein